MLDVKMLTALALPVLSSAPSVRAAWLFGSVARGQATELSDVDIAVVGHGADVLALGAALSEPLRREVDVVEIDLEAPVPLLRAIMRDGVRIYEREPGMAAAFASQALSVLALDGPNYDRMMRAFMARVARRGVGT